MEHALADHGRTLPRLRQTALMAASAAQKVVDSTTVIFVESTFAQMDGVLKIGSGDAAVVIQPSASNDGTLLAYSTSPIALTDQPVAASACASIRCSGRSSRATRPAPNNPTNRGRRVAETASTPTSLS
jgi:hypothetical protein